MAEEAFALSPISARAALPSEEDYAAISEAFMETSRGRWFLGEYAKRNRNADTRMVLDAVARIEESLASQKQAAADTRLTEALATIRHAVGEAQAATTSALDAMAVEQHIAPIRKGVRVIREISWRLREIGADGRICDILDSQVAAIETSAEHIASVQVRPAVDAAFAELLAEFEEFEARGETHAPAPEPEETRARVVPFPAPAEPEPVVEAKVEPVTAANIEAVEPEPPQPMMEAPAEAVAAVEAPPEPVAFSAPPEPEIPAPAAKEPAEMADAAAAEAHDEAVLDLIAAEMAAPDPVGMDESFETAAMPEAIAEPAPVAPAPEAIAETSAIVEVPVQATTIAPQPSIAPQPVIAPSPEPQPPPPVQEISLGSTILASGMLKKPAPANDPLSPIRRMSQAERIAFFS
ncbi:hypothetical protein JQ628_02025 [Bradyrhizobium lablabi]|uniref:hypothetical protein n=1 Tax=Bradyrhizobium lablabi TaxID=722472 RepID=UPI001BA8C470|nr:hypothetical protein [Bradyrhizobium lablabi]MBR1120276.1 hypothetical protein [Bradyrhizobium lablabi]